MTRARWWLLIILVVSAGLRVELATRGGQFYWPDETRYAGVRHAVDAWVQGDRAAFVENMLGTSDHILFRPIAVIPAVIERIWFDPAEPPAALAAIFFGLFGVAAILMVWLIVQRATGREAAATWSAAFYAGSTGAFLFARHYFPYDAGLFFLLLGWWIGLKNDRARRLWAAGAVIGVGYLVYNAYWNIGAAMLAALTMRLPVDFRLWFRRAGWMACGLVTPVIVMYGVAALAGYNLVAHAREFSQSVVQGDFGRGWWFLLSYFAVTERAFVLWLLLLLGVGAVVGLQRDRRWPGWGWGVLALVLALQIIVLSDVIPRFAVAGRMIKPLMVFVAMAAGTATARLLEGRKPIWIGLVAGMTGLLIARNFAPVLAQVFPPEFRQQANAVVERELAERSDAVLQLYYAGFMHRASFLPPPPPHEVLLSEPHPHAFRPYQFEGYVEQERAKFANHDFPMRLIRLREEVPAPEADAEWSPFAGALELAVTLPEPRPVGRTEPLVVTGETGKGDLISLHYLDEQRLQVVADHWGWGAWRSEPFAVPASGPHRVLISSGALLPPAEHPFMQAHPALQPLTQRLIVEWNDELVAQAELPFFPVSSDRLFLGRNEIGGSTAEPAFTGSVAVARYPDLTDVARAEWGLPLPSHQRGSWGGRVGPVFAVVEWSKSAESFEVDVVRVQRGVEGLTVKAHGDRGAVRYSLWMTTSWWSPPVQVAISAPQPRDDGRHELWLSSGLTTPEPHAVPANEALRAAWLLPRCILAVDGMAVLDVPGAFSGIEMAETLAGRPALPVRVRWGADAVVGGTEFPGQIRRTGAVPIDRFAPAAGLVGPRLEEPEQLDAARVFHLTLRLPVGDAAPPEPLLVSGRPGAADGVFILHDRADRLRVGHDHWGAAAALSEPFAVDRSQVQEVVISMAPEATSSGGRRTGVVMVTWNGQTVLREERRTVVDAGAHEIGFGVNRIGMGTSIGDFSGQILKVELETQRP